MEKKRTGEGLTLSGALFAWYDKNGRTHLPWRKSPSPYHVWVSEIMLQQTRVETVIPYYTRWMEALPDLQALADCPEERLLKLWEGLGYYSRARNLKKAAQQVQEQWGGMLPSNAAQLRTLSGIGPYTAGAIASIAFGEQEIAADGNAYRIAARLLREEEPVEKGATRKRLEEFLRAQLSAERPGDFNQALMDLGSGLCLSNGKPLCGGCPLREFCAGAEVGDARRFPIRLPKKARRIEKKTIFTIWKKDHILLHKRPEDGLLAGMWELPNQEGFLSKAAVEQWARAAFGPVFVVDLGRKKHIFSHIEWHMRGFLIRVGAKKTDTPDEGKDSYAQMSMPELPAESEKPKDFADVFAEIASNNLQQRWVSRDTLRQEVSIPSAFSAYVVESPQVRRRKTLEKEEEE